MEAYLSGEPLPSGKIRCPKCRNVHSIAGNRTAEQPVASESEGETAALKEAYSEHGVEYTEVRMECPHCHTVYETHGASPPPEPTDTVPASETQPFDFEPVRAALASKRFNAALEMLLQYQGIGHEPTGERGIELVPAIVNLVLNSPFDWQTAHEDELGRAMKPFSAQLVLEVLKRLEAYVEDNGASHHIAILDYHMRWLLLLTPPTAFTAVPVLKSYANYLKRSSGTGALFINAELHLKMAKQMCAPEASRRKPWWKRMFGIANKPDARDGL